MQLFSLKTSDFAKKLQRNEISQALHAVHFKMYLVYIMSWLLNHSANAAVSVVVKDQQHRPYLTDYLHSNRL